MRSFDSAAQFVINLKSGNQEREKMEAPSRTEAGETSNAQHPRPAHRELVTEGT